MKRVLVVDDDLDLTYLVERILKSNGFDVKIHLTGLYVLDVVRNFNPHLVLMDILLNGHPGTDLCKQIKAKYNVPVILFSCDVKTGESFRQWNGDGFIAKPFDIGELLAGINQYLSNAEYNTTGK